MQDSYAARFGPYAADVRGVEDIFSLRFERQFASDPARAVKYFRNWTESDLQDLSRRFPEFFDALVTITYDAKAGNAFAQRSLEYLTPNAFCDVEAFKDAIYRTARSAGYTISANQTQPLDPQTLLGQLDGIARNDIRLAENNAVVVPNVENALAALKARAA